jgi:hypothetical protein
MWKAQEVGNSTLLQATTACRCRAGTLAKASLRSASSNNSRPVGHRATPLQPEKSFPLRTSFFFSEIARRPASEEAAFTWDADAGSVESIADDCANDVAAKLRRRVEDEGRKRRIGERRAPPRLMLDAASDDAAANPENRGAPILLPSDASL